MRFSFSRLRLHFRSGTDVWLFALGVVAILVCVALILTTCNACRMVVVLNNGTGQATTGQTAGKDFGEAFGLGVAGSVALPAGQAGEAKVSRTSLTVSQPETPTHVPSPPPE